MPTGEQGGSEPKPIAPVKFWLKSALVIVMVGILLAFAWLHSGPKEPVYQNKTLTEWLMLSATSKDGSKERKDCELAVRQIGTNGIPTLLKLIAAQDTNLNDKINDLLEKQHLISSRVPSASERQSRAIAGFMMLRAEAKAAVPELVSLLQTRKDESDRLSIIYALTEIGPAAQAAIPSLKKIARTGEERERDWAIIALGKIRSLPETTVPFLAELLSDSNHGYRCSAAISLGLFGHEAQSAVPALLKALLDPDREVRIMTTNSLKAIDPAAATKAGIR